MSAMSHVLRKRASDDHLCLEVYRIMEPSSVKKGRPTALKNYSENDAMSGAKKTAQKKAAKDAAKKAAIYVPKNAIQSTLPRRCPKN